MFHDTTFPPPDGRLAQFARIVAALDRQTAEGAVELLIARLDAEDGDTDLEETGAEDSFVEHLASGPGCPVSDPDCAIEDDPAGFDPEDDCCAAGDDMVAAGPVVERGRWLDGASDWQRQWRAGLHIGDEDDAEHDYRRLEHA
ncbi:hypothetical protein SAMN06297144_3442 [Sphingomonas guangdongensis]|uniref:Uncharacterized protein n=1 Tax=Sphingomonas guangdongensis TaxID=1141890 RepID=A0A285R2H2_9SPHN|nr:hypothetical protein [Sphingomonas guangdongensis]SOB88291.1 hypothetical protein SAMN06297144_3442 [Sphingomonas guangdongensis]